MSCLPTCFGGASLTYAGGGTSGRIVSSLCIDASPFISPHYRAGIPGMTVWRSAIIIDTSRQWRLALFRRLLSQHRPTAPKPATTATTATAIIAMTIFQIRQRVVDATTQVLLNLAGRKGSPTVRNPSYRGYVVCILWFKGQELPRLSDNQGRKLRFASKCREGVYIPQVLSVTEAWFGGMNAISRAIGSSCRSRKINAITKTWEESHVILKARWQYL